ncbi:Cof-type HAD-IIB family hydrolase [Alkalibacter mobilis]|uniref:Cof-type HAD-IIB family hydrolase n=1 Tax=Alkalibacter mobilis TaxID=2787712 RepID=UPI00189D64C7|nr:Cof-type HAD-IIB family hydrolase [Alkalibacter mobilis]MBF7096671.1 HAD family phosphatase [Alkalibacter mobilis]
MIRLLALDIDGTLLDKENKIRDTVREAVKTTLKKGIEVAVLSGRNYDGMKMYIEELGLKGMAAAANGVQIVNIASNEIVCQKEMDPEISKDIINEAVKLDLTIVNFAGLMVYTEGFEGIPPEYIKPLNQKFVFIENIMEHVKENTPIKLLMVGERENLDEFRLYVEKSYGNELNVEYSMTNLLEVYSKGVDKGKALEYLMKFYGIGRHETLCIGDSENDIAMFQVSGTAVAMGNAPEHVKEKADQVTESSECDGVAFAIEKWVL